VKKYTPRAAAALLFGLSALMPVQPAAAHGFLHGDSPFRFGISMYIARPLRIGVTMPVYESWIRNVVFDRAEIIAFDRADLEPADDAAWQHTVERLRAVDLFIVSEHPTDEYIDALLEKSDLMYQVPLIYADLGASPLVHRFDVPEDRVPPRPYLALTSAAQQMYTMSNALMRMDPANNLDIRRNLQGYTGTLSETKRKLVKSVPDWSGEELFVLSIDGGYEYLIEEVGFTPLPPLADAEALFAKPAELKKALGDQRVDVIATTQPMDEAQVEALKKSCGAEVIQIDPIESIDGSEKSYETYWQRNLENLLALRTRLLEARQAEQGA
jgi:ABC-type Zn uptake system ZnuABC Zn-binding protein ZnuA